MSQSVVLAIMASAHARTVSVDQIVLRRAMRFAMTNRIMMAMVSPIAKTGVVRAVLRAVRQRHLRHNIQHRHQRPHLQHPLPRQRQHQMKYFGKRVVIPGALIWYLVPLHQQRQAEFSVAPPRATRAPGTDQRTRTMPNLQTYVKA